MANKQAAGARSSIPSAPGITYIKKSVEESKDGFGRARDRPQTSQKSNVFQNLRPPNARAAH